jgi:hypothetical protein
MRSQNESTVLTRIKMRVVFFYPMARYSSFIAFGQVVLLNFSRGKVCHCRSNDALLPRHHQALGVHFYTSGIYKMNGVNACVQERNIDRQACRFIPLWHTCALNHSAADVGNHQCTRS